jgi:hypothetical protein
VGTGSSEGSVGWAGGAVGTSTPGSGEGDVAEMNGVELEGDVAEMDGVELEGDVAEMDGVELEGDVAELDGVEIGGAERGGEAGGAETPKRHAAPATRSETATDATFNPVLAGPPVPERASRTVSPGPRTPAAAATTAARQRGQLGKCRRTRASSLFGQRPAARAFSVGRSRQSRSISYYRHDAAQIASTPAPTGPSSPRRRGCVADCAGVLRFARARAFSTGLLPELRAGRARAVRQRRGGEPAHEV